MLAARLAERAPTLVHCGQIQPGPELPGIDFQVDFDHARPWTLDPLSKSDIFRPDDTVLCQYTNFAYGRWGFNPWLAPALRRLRSRGLFVATMFHETYMGPPRGIKIRMMRAWQKFFFRQVGLASQLCMFSVDPWTEQYRSWFPHARVETLSVGSNIPRVPVDRVAERARLGIPVETPVLGVFGGTHPSRLFDWIEAASRHLTGLGIDHRILRIGPDSSEVASRLAGSPLLDLGVLPPFEVSQALSCCDLFLSPISDGASSRRSGLLAGLSHGLACVSTLGESSDELFRKASGNAMEYAVDRDAFARVVAELCRDSARRERLGAEALRFHDQHFGWNATADRFLRLVATVRAQSGGTATP